MEPLPCIYNPPSYASLLNDIEYIQILILVSIDVRRKLLRTYYLIFQLS